MADEVPRRVYLKLVVVVQHWIVRESPRPLLLQPGSIVSIPSHKSFDVASDRSSSNENGRTPTRKVGCSKYRQCDPLRSSNEDSDKYQRNHVGQREE